MKYRGRIEVASDVADRSKRDIAAVNEYMDGLKGFVISFERIRSGQQGAYGPTVEEYRIFAHQPNVLTTNAPLTYGLTRRQVLEIAHTFLGTFNEGQPKFLERRLQSLEPEPNPAGLKEYSGVLSASCWRLILYTPYDD